MTSRSAVASRPSAGSIFGDSAVIDQLSRVAYRSFFASAEIAIVANIVRAPVRPDASRDRSGAVAPRGGLPARPVAAVRLRFALQVIQLAGVSRLQIRQIAGRNRQVENAVFDPFEIDAHRLGRGSRGDGLSSPAAGRSASRFGLLLVALPRQAATADRCAARRDRRCASDGCRWSTAQTSRAPVRHRSIRTSRDTCRCDRRPAR